MIPQTVSTPRAHERDLCYNRYIRPTSRRNDRDKVPTTTMRPVWLSITVNYHKSTPATFELLKSTPEVTIVRVEDGCFDGAFTIEFYIDATTDRDEFIKDFTEKFLATTEDGQLADDTWQGDGEIDHKDNPNADVWVMRVRPAPTSQ